MQTAAQSIIQIRICRAHAFPRVPPYPCTETFNAIGYTG